MINLLPPSLKFDYQYARRNHRLLHVIAVFGIGFAGLAAIGAAGVVYIQQSTSNYVVQADAIRQNLQRQKQDEVKAQAQDVSNSLKLAVQVLSQQVLFSQLLKQLAVVVPEKVNLTGITISDLQGAVDVSARAEDYTSGTQLQVNLADPVNKIFSRADIINITCTTETESPDQEEEEYPCTVNIRAEFAADNPFLFINDKGGE